MAIDTKIFLKTILAMNQTKITTII
ncbi:uncharacterized protein METZ01_LOCUS440740, partial [marine metagenome]